VERIAIIGSGMIGRAWAIVFARGGFPVALWDGAPEAAREVLRTIRARLGELHDAGLLDDPDAAFARITLAGSLGEAVAGAEYVQENLPETVEVKRAVFAEMDAVAPAGAILASSTSAIPSSSFTEELPGRARCLVAHPANPPYLIPVVELCGAPWTAPETLERARDLLERAGQEPVLVRREIRGFILNRIQGALLNEAFRLVDEGFVTPEDLDKVVSHGLGLRWSFMGPFETIDLNAPGGVRDYCERYGPFYREMRQQSADPGPWSEELIASLAARRRAEVPAEAHAERQAWRDRRLMALAVHKRAAEAVDTQAGRTDTKAADGCV
jgi:L-gulonate 3-dehydrogenase